MNPNNFQGKFLAEDTVKGKVKAEIPGGHVEAGPKGRLYSSQQDAPAPRDPMPEHFPGGWTLPR